MALSRNLVNAAVVLAVVLGLRTAEMSATFSLIIHGPRAPRLVNVGCGEAGFVACDVMRWVSRHHVTALHSDHLFAI